MTALPAAPGFKNVTVAFCVFASASDSIVVESMDPQKEKYSSSDSFVVLNERPVTLTVDDEVAAEAMVAVRLGVNEGG